MASFLLTRFEPVALRILVDGNPPAETVHLEGRLSRDLLPELERVLAGRDESCLRIDVAHLTSADADGTAVLKRLLARGVAIQGASPYLRLLLGESEA
jgi:ABC-type transporter Mla MlaB component